MTNKNSSFNPFKSLLHIIAFIALFIVEQIPLSLLVVTKKELGASYESYMKMAPYLSIILMIVAGVILYLVFKKAQKFPTQKFTSKTWLTIVAGVILSIIINLATIPFMRDQNVNVDALQTVGQNSKFILIISAVIVSPILEEILFRGILMNWFFANTPVVSIVISGVVFGFIHAPISSGTDWVYALSKILMGLLLAIVYYRTKNIKADITVHFLNNFLAIALAL